MLRKHTSALVVEAEDGSQALDIIQHSAVDAVFLDLQMPVMDGLEVLAALRGDIAYHSLPVIVLSALSDLATVRQAIKLGITDYLVKPLRPRLMEPRLQSLLAIAAKRQVTTGAGAAGAPGPAPENRPRVLLVDGDAKFAAFFTGLLEADHEVVHVDNGREAARVLSGWTPKIACLGPDLRLPSALELARKLRKLRGGMSLYLCARRPPSPARRPRSSTRSCREPSSPRPSARSSPGCAPPRRPGSPRAGAYSMTGSARTS
jgi:CheY-like chemotaxis protein